MYYTPTSAAIPRHMVYRSDVASDLIGRAVRRLVTEAHEQLTVTGPGRRTGEGMGGQACQHGKSNRDGSNEFHATPGCN
jgi:hypothetical protein